MSSGIARFAFRPTGKTPGVKPNENDASAAPKSAEPTTTAVKQRPLFEIFGGGKFDGKSTTNTAGEDSLFQKPDAPAVASKGLADFPFSEATDNHASANFPTKPFAAEARENKEGPDGTAPTRHKDVQNVAKDDGDSWLKSSSASNPRRVSNATELDHSSPPMNSALPSSLPKRNTMGLGSEIERPQEKLTFGSDSVSVQEKTPASNTSSVSEVVDAVPRGKPQSEVAPTLDTAAVRGIQRLPTMDNANRAFGEGTSLLPAQVTPASSRKISNLDLVQPNETQANSGIQMSDTAASKPNTSLEKESGKELGEEDFELAFASIKDKQQAFDDGTAAYNEQVLDLSSKMCTVHGEILKFQTSVVSSVLVELDKVDEWLEAAIEENSRA